MKRTPRPAVPDPPEWGRPVRRVSARPGLAPALDSWPMTIPAVRQLLADGLELGPLTVLVGENGAGKSTLVEAIATPGAVLYEVGDWGLRRSSWAELAMVRDWRGFMDAPDRYLRHLPGASEQE